MSSLLYNKKTTICVACCVVAIISVATTALGMGNRLGGNSEAVSIELPADFSIAVPDRWPCFEEIPLAHMMDPLWSRHETESRTVVITAELLLDGKTIKSEILYEVDIEPFNVVLVQPPRGREVKFMTMMCDVHIPYVKRSVDYYQTTVRFEYRVHQNDVIVESGKLDCQLF